MGRPSGADLGKSGLNMDFARGAALNTNPNNPVIGNRACSSDCNVAGQMAKAMAEGLEEQGFVPVFKHFPGHGGTSTDSHDGATYLYRTLDQLRQGELIPFQAGIEAGADAVMMGHLIVPDLDDQPAPLSYEIVTGLLREEMGFNGVVMTDAMEMSALTKYYTGGQAAGVGIPGGGGILLVSGGLGGTRGALGGAGGGGPAPSTTADAGGGGGLPGILSSQPASMLSFALCMVIAIVIPCVLTVSMGKKKGVA